MVKLYGAEVIDQSGIEPAVPAVKQKRKKYVTMDETYAASFGGQVLKIPCRTLSHLNDFIPYTCSNNIRKSYKRKKTIITQRTSIQEYYDLYSDNDTEDAGVVDVYPDYKKFIDLTQDTDPPQPVEEPPVPDYAKFIDLTQDTDPPEAVEEPPDELNEVITLPPDATPSATRAILSELKRFRNALQTSDNCDFRLDESRLENLYQWHISITDFDKTLPIAKQMNQHKIPAIQLELSFGPTYPSTPPYIRIVKPRFLMVHLHILTQVLPRRRRPRNSRRQHLYRLVNYGQCK